MYYYVTEDTIDQERHEPHSCQRKAMPEHGLYLWNQAMFVLEQLLTAGLLHINELDPIRRYLPSYNRPRKGGRYSAFQVRIFETLIMKTSGFHGDENVAFHCENLPCVLRN